MSDEDAGATTPKQGYQLPEIVVPSLDDLRVQVTAAAPPTGEELIERLHSRLREKAARRERKPGDAIELGDEVECDVITVVDGQVIPGSIKSAVRFEMREFPHMPGFLEQLLSMTTFSAKTFELEMPETYPLPELAGRKATFYVEARRVYQVAPIEVEDVAALRSAGLGESLEEALETISAEIDVEQGEEMLVEATQVVLEALALRVKEEIPSTAIDQELRLTWQSSEGVLLHSKNLPPEMVEAAEADFISQPTLRAEAELRIKTGLALGAIVEQQGLAPTAEIMNMLIDAAAEEVGTTSEEAKKSLAEDPAYAMRAGQTALYLNAVEFVMSRAIVEVLDPLET